MKNGKPDQIDTNQPQVLLRHLEWVERPDALFHAKNRTQAKAGCRMPCCNQAAL